MAAPSPQSPAAWRVLILAGMLVSFTRCTLFVDVGGLSGGAAEPAVDASPDVSADGTADATIDAPRDAAPLPDGAVVWSGNGHGYLLVVHSSVATWEAAKKEAEALGGHLATISSAAENDFVFSLLKNRDDAWSGTNGPFLGGFQVPGSSEPGGGWSWVTGEPWSFTKWDPAEPNDQGGDESYVAFFSTDSPLWNDTNDGVVKAFVVELE